MEQSRQAQMNNYKAFGRRPGNRNLTVEKAKDKKGTLKRLIAYFAAEKAMIIGLLAAVIVVVICSVYAPKLQSNAIDIIASGRFKELTPILITMVVVYIIHSICTFLQTKISAVLSQNIVKKMREDLGYAVKDVSDVEHKELTPNEVLEIFEKRYKKYTPVFKIKEVHFKQIDGIQTEVTIEEDGKDVVINAGGNGRLDAVSNALAKHFGKPCDVMCYEEHSLKKGSDSSAIAYVGIKGEDGKEYFGIGIDHDIIKASIDAVESAMNRSMSN